MGEFVCVRKGELKWFTQVRFHLLYPKQEVYFGKKKKTITLMFTNCLLFECLTCCALRYKKEHALGRFLFPESMPKVTEIHFQTVRSSTKSYRKLHENMDDDANLGELHGCSGNTSFRERGFLTQHQINITDEFLVYVDCVQNLFFKYNVRLT